MNKIKNRIVAYFRGPNFLAGLLVAIIIASVVFVNIIAYTLTNAFELYFPKSSEADMSISDVGDTMFADALESGKQVSITFCMYREELEKHSTGKFVLKTAEEFAKKYPSLVEVRFANAITKLYSDRRTPFDPESYKSMVDPISGDRIENRINESSVIFEHSLKDPSGNVIRTSTRVVTDAFTTAGFGDFFTLDSSYVATSYNGEEVLASMIKWVLSDTRETAYVTVGHGESADVTLYNILACAGYYVKEINLKNEAVPENAGLLVISNPVHDFEYSSRDDLVTEMTRLEAYAERGGSFYIATDPYAASLPILERFISSFGITSVKSDTKDRPIVKESSNAITADGFTLVSSLWSGETAKKMTAASGADGGVILRYASALVLSGAAEPILKTSPSSVLEASGRVVDREGSYTIAAYSERAAGEKSAKLFYIPSVYLAATDAMVSDSYSNKDFLYSLFDVCFEKGEMAYGASRYVYESGILENLTMGVARIYTAAFVAFPVAVALVGAVIIIRRKNR